MATPLDHRKVAETNPGVDAKMIDQLAAYRALLKKVGLAEGPDYRLSPPLGPGHEVRSRSRSGRGSRLRSL